MTATIGYENLLESGTVSASTEASGFEKENAYDHHTHDHWKPSAVAAWLKVDAGSLVDVDYFGLGAHDLGTQGATIVLQHATDAAFTTPVNAFTPISPSDDSPIIRAFTAINKQHWRIYMTVAIASIGHAAFGERLDLPLAQGTGYRPIDESRATKKTMTISESGQVLGSTIERDGATGSIAIRNMSDAFRRANWSTLAAHLDSGKLSFFCNDVENHSDEVALFWVPGRVPTPTYNGNLKLSASLSIRAQVR